MLKYFKIICINIKINNIINEINLIFQILLKLLVTK